MDLFDETRASYCVSLSALAIVIYMLLLFSETSCMGKVKKWFIMKLHCLNLLGHSNETNKCLTPWNLSFTMFPPRLRAYNNRKHKTPRIPPSYNFRSTHLPPRRNKSFHSPSYRQSEVERAHSSIRYQSRRPQHHRRPAPPQRRPLSMSTNAPRRTMAKFDTDSFVIGIDNHTSRSIKKLYR